MTKAQEWGIECVNVQWLSELVLGNLRALKLPIDRKYKVFNKPDDFTIDQSMAASVMCESTPASLHFLVCSTVLGGFRYRRLADDIWSYSKLVLVENLA